MSAQVELRKVNRTFPRKGGSVQALFDVDLLLRPDDWMVIVGVSGSGKTTLLQLVGGLDRPTSGQILYNEVDLAALRSDELATFRRTRVGFVFQSFNLIPTLTALENVCLPFFPYGLSTEEMNSRAMAALEQVGMVDRKNHLPGELSGGEQQRVAIARALVNEPEILLADEPTGDLDAITGDKILDLLQTLHRDRGMTILVTSHDPRVAERACSAVRLENGCITDFQRKTS